MLNTPQAVPLICKASVVQVYIYTYLWEDPGHVTRLRLRNGNLEQLLVLPLGQAWLQGNRDYLQPSFIPTILPILVGPKSGLLPCARVKDPPTACF